MNLETAIEGMIQTREALNSQEGIFLPAFISEKIQTLAQYVGVIENVIAENEEVLALAEAKRYKEYLAAGKKTSTAKDMARADFVKEHAEINKLSRYVSSSWKIVSTSQSRVKHLIEESRNQV